MSAVVSVGGARVELSPNDALATGGEATVYAVGGRALKIWQAPTAARAAKLAALLARRGALPAAVVAAEEPVLDAARGHVVGFAMPLVPASYEPLAVLASPAQRAARGISMRLALGALRHLAQTLAALHAAGIVVGDLSDQNVLVDAADPSPVRLVDVDSFQLDGLPCLVSTESFLDPNLYGPDVTRPCLTASGFPRTFGAESDDYAFAVLLFRTLCGAHPYGGALDALPTLPRRALARASLFRAEVRVPPRVRESMGLFDAALRSRLEAIFERGDRATLEVSVIERCAGALVTCGCGLEIPASRLPCPRCAGAPAILVGPLASGGLRVTVVLEAGGPVVALACRGDDVLALAIENALPVLYVVRSDRVDRHVVAADAARSGWDVALGSGVAMLAARGAGPVAAVAIVSLTPRGVSVEATTTERARGVAAFAAADDTFFRVARGTVLAGRANAQGMAERPVATVMTGATRLWGATLGGDPVALALGAMLGAPRWEAIGARRVVALEPPALSPGETLREVAAYGDGDGVIVLARTRIAGRALVRLSRFDAQGCRTSDRVAPEDGRAAEDVIAGGAARGGAVMLATSRGLVREAATGPERVFGETAAFTSPSAPVALARGGALVADGRTVRRLEMH